MVLLGDNPRTEAALQRVVPRIYGERWWQAGQSPGNLLLQ
jgi:hypothetical protein